MTSKQLQDSTLTIKEIAGHAQLTERTVRNNETKWGLDKLVYGARNRKPRLYKRAEAIRLLTHEGIFSAPI